MKEVNGCAFCVFSMRDHSMPCEQHRSESDKAVLLSRGKRVEVARMVKNSLDLTFEDGTMLSIYDRAQSCCEVRWMSCDDDLQSFTGDKFVGFDVLDGPYDPSPDHDNEHDVHDVQFLHVRFASGNVITAQTHNEHNGFYGGFDIEASLS